MSKCTRKPLTAQAVEQAMEEHESLIHVFIRRQGGGDIPYEEALQASRCESPHEWALVSSGR